MRRSALYFITIFTFSLLLAGCQTTVSQMEAVQYYPGDDSSRQNVIIPIDTDDGWKMTLFDEKISYRNDKKATIEFSLPRQVRKNADSMEMDIAAYNDDRAYLRAIWFEVDGVGGYLGTGQLTRSQVRGDGTLQPGEAKKLTFDLSKCQVSSKTRGKKEINFTKMLLQPGTHTLSSWISTYGKYGPDSRISIDLMFRPPEQTEDPQ